MHADEDCIAMRRMIVANHAVLCVRLLVHRTLKHFAIECIQGERKCNSVAKPGEDGQGSSCHFERGSLIPTACGSQANGLWNESSFIPEEKYLAVARRVFWKTTRLLLAGPLPPA
jgi:hypothetical protein